MAFALIRDSDNVWLGGPFDTEPTPGDGEHVVTVLIGYPDKCEWSPSRNGFVDIVIATPLLTKLEFQRRFTMAERIAIRASADPVVLDYRALGELAEGIDLADPDVIAGTGYLESVGLIGIGRATEVLTP